MAKVKTQIQPTNGRIAESLHPLAVPIDSVTLDPKNARQHPGPNLDAIKRSLQQYGQRKPIVVNSRTGIIEAGNGLWTAAKALGWDTIAVVKVEDDSDNATGYALMDNQSALLADWDMPVLGEMVLDLKNADFDLSLTGFDGKDIAAMVTMFNPISGDNVARLDEKKKVVCPECGHEFTP
jgi:hypothetical protein